MAAYVRVENLTGHVMTAVVCGSMFQVVLVVNSSHPTPTWLACAQSVTIPTGVSTYPVVIASTYYDGGERPLPVGTYEATTYEMGNAAPLPSPAKVRITR
jgi:hypothetical protein